MSTFRIHSAGQLNTQVQFQERTPGENALRERSGAWRNRGEPVFAAVQPVRGAERLQAGAVQATLDVIVIVRWRDWVTADMRFLWRGRPYEIVAVVPVDGGREWLEISAVTGAADGRQF